MIIFTYIATAMFLSGGIYQIYHMIKHKTAKDISFIYATGILLGVTSVSMLIFLTDNDFRVWLQQICNLTITVIVYIFIIRYKIRDFQRRVRIDPKFTLEKIGKQR